MTGKPKIGEDPLWWIQADGRKKTGKTAAKARTAKKPAGDWIRTVLEVRSSYLQRLNRMAEKEGASLRKILDDVLGGALSEKKTPSHVSQRKRSGRTGR